jgi:hypothetical protein
METTYRIVPTTPPGTGAVHAVPPRETPIGAERTATDIATIATVVGNTSWDGDDAKAAVVSAMASPYSPNDLHTIAYQADQFNVPDDMEAQLFAAALQSNRPATEIRDIIAQANTMTVESDAEHLQLTVDALHGPHDARDATRLLYFIDYALSSTDITAERGASLLLAPQVDSNAVEGFVGALEQSSWSSSMRAQAFDAAMQSTIPLQDAAEFVRAADAFHDNDATEIQFFTELLGLKPFGG